MGKHPAPFESEILKGLFHGQHLLKQAKGLTHDLEHLETQEEYAEAFEKWKWIIQQLAREFSKIREAQVDGILDDLENTALDIMREEFDAWFSENHSYEYEPTEIEAYLETLGMLVVDPDFDRGACLKCGLKGANMDEAYELHKRLLAKEVELAQYKQELERAGRRIDELEIALLIRQEA